VIVGDCLADHSEGLSAVGGMLGRQPTSGQPYAGLSLGTFAPRTTLPLG